MIVYNEDYLIRLLWRLDGSVGPRALLFAIPAGIFAVILLVCEDHVHNFFQETGIDAITGSQSWAAVTGVLTLLLSFRSRQALSRFWEGTGLLHQMRGEWFDSVSCCVTFTRGALESKRQDVMDFRHTIIRLMSLCHGSALEEIADDNGDDINIPTIDIKGLDTTTILHLKECKEKHDFNRVEVILHLIQTLITKNLDKGVLKIPPPILSRVYQTLSRGFVNLLNAKKITDTRFPFPYAQLISMLLVLHTVLTPVMISELISHKAWAFVFTVVPIFGMFSLNFTASQLENPFGNDDNDLPLEDFQDEMNSSLLMLLHQNSDHIAGISDTAVLDFEELAGSVKDENEGAVPRVGLLPSLNSNSNSHQLDSPRGGSPRGSPRSSTRSSPCALIAAAAKALADSGALSMNAEADFPTDESCKALPLPPSLNVSLVPVTAPPALDPPAPAAPAAPAQVAPPGAPQARLVTDMDDFNLALQSWTKIVDSQIGELSRSFADLRRISDSMPALLEVAQASRSRGKEVAEDEVLALKGAAALGSSV
uniref:Bestrophin homolog n=1 Tax=Alexandrium catenella TaxID=2925 RepID=A0A7S1RDA9_ALECA|mmetsp:Transcript_53/g.142  ORF Transcript_53/g.142 Transcript_53/m.142 type:complete len:538 (+) Transcript_53:99-1712(+)